MHWLDWRRWLVYTHRWLGIVGGVLFVAWFFSGVVMMYARMPGLANEERLARAHGAGSLYGNRVAARGCSGGESRSMMTLRRGPS